MNTGLLPAAPPAPEGDVEESWRRVPPRSALANLGVVSHLVVSSLLLSTAYGFGTLGYVLVGLGSGTLLGWTALSRWLFTRYRVTDQVVELRTGLFVRRHESVPRDRVRTVDLTARLPHRVLRLATVRLGTGAQTLVIDALRVQEADRLRTLLLASVARRVVPGARREGMPTPAPATVSAETEPVELAAWSNRWLRYAPLSLSGFAVAGSLLVTVFNHADDVGLDLFGVAADHIDKGRLWTDLIVAAVLLPILATVFSLAKYVLLYGGYRLTRHHDDTLRARYGLLTTRLVAVEEARLRGVSVTEPLLVRLAGGATARMVTTGLGGGASLLVPQAPRELVHRLCAAALRLPLSPTKELLWQHGAAALRRRLFRAVAPTAVPIAAAVLWAPTWSWVSAAIVLPALGIALARDRYASLGHGLTDTHLVARQGSLLRRTVALQRTGIVGWTVTQSWSQRRVGLFTLGAMTAAGSRYYEILDVPGPEGLALADQAVPDLLRPFLDPDALPAGGPR